MAETIGQGPDYERFIRCNCGANQFLVLAGWQFTPVEGRDFADIAILDQWRAPRGLWARLKAAWAIFWHGEFTSSSISLSAQDVENLIVWLKEIQERFVLEHTISLSTWSSGTITTSGFPPNLQP